VIELKDTDYKQLWIILKNVVSMLLLVAEVNPTEGQNADSTLLNIMNGLEEKLLKEKEGISGQPKH